VSKKTWFRGRRSSASQAFSDRSEGGRAQRPRLPSFLSHPGCSDQIREGRSTLGKILGEMKISAAKKQVLQSIASSLNLQSIASSLNLQSIASSLNPNIKP
jgi:hypothetical protein